MLNFLLYCLLAFAPTEAFASSNAALVVAGEPGMCQMHASATFIRGPNGEWNPYFRAIDHSVGCPCHGSVEIQVSGGEYAITEWDPNLGDIIPPAYEGSGPTEFTVDVFPDCDEIIIFNVWHIAGGTWSYEGVIVFQCKGACP